MILNKRIWPLSLLVLANLFYISNSIECKICRKSDSRCLLGDDAAVKRCINPEDICYSWFDRTGGTIGVQRGCISTDSLEYEFIKDLIGPRNNGCIKRLNGLDCFRFCSDNACN